MKKAAIFFILLFTAAAFPLQAAEIEPEGTALRKLQRGFLNITLSPIEISNELAKEKTRDTFPPSWMLGFARGTFFMLGRAVTGVYEIITFPMPLPSGYAPILQPEFPWQHFPKMETESKKLASS